MIHSSAQSTFTRVGMQYAAYVYLAFVLKPPSSPDSVAGGTVVSIALAKNPIPRTKWNAVQHAFKWEDILHTTWRFAYQQSCTMKSQIHRDAILSPSRLVQCGSKKEHNM